MNKKLLHLTILLVIIVSLTFSIGIFNNPSFSLNDFFLGISIETLGWILGVTLFQSYYSERLAARDKEIEKHEGTVADEILKFKQLLEEQIISQEEFDKAKRNLLVSLEAEKTFQRK